LEIEGGRSVSRRKKQLTTDENKSLSRASYRLEEPKPTLYHSECNSIGRRINKRRKNGERREEGKNALEELQVLVGGRVASASPLSVVSIGVVQPHHPSPSLQMEKKNYWARLPRRES
jgi:hypothetical protein